MNICEQILVGKTCYFAGKRHDFITLFREDAAFKTMCVPQGADNSPSCLVQLVLRMGWFELEALKVALKELEEEEVKDG